MPNPLKDFLPFLAGLWSHINTLISGCAVTFVIGLIEKRVLKRPISLKTEIGILLAFVFFACFQTWRDQYQHGEALQAKLSQTPTPSFTINVPSAQPPIVNVQPQINVPATQRKVYVDLAQLALGSIPDKSELFVNAYVINFSDYPANYIGSLVHACAAKTEAVLNHHPTISVQEDCYGNLNERSKSIPGDLRIGMILAPKQGLWGSSILSVDQKLRKELDSGDKVFMFTGMTEFSDESGKYRKEYCRWVQSPFSIDHPLWQVCQVHNGLSVIK